MRNEQVDMVNQLTAVVFQREDLWVAMFMEKYIGTQGRTKKEAIDRLRIVYRAELDHSVTLTGKAFGGIMESPREYRDKLDNDPSAQRIVIHDKDYCDNQASLLAA